ncbi:SIR2 family protein [Peribacillus sp. Hz7]|uniref:SIR2 family protein n=1 Tax=Peribacillus sp. Hz7 TaxID=3344873 RepID=UPI0035C96B8B
MRGKSFRFNRTELGIGERIKWIKEYTYPISVYNNIFTNSIFSNSSLLICGYSFSDTHINKVIERMSAIHGKNRKIVIITYLSDYWRKNWTPETQIMGLSHEMFTFVAKSFNEYRPFEKLRYSNPMVSNDGCVRVYFEGFKNTIEKHGEDIINFLK